MSKALHQAHLDRITPANKHDRNFVRRFCCGERLRGTDGKDDVDPVLHQLVGERPKPLLPAFTVARHDEKVLPVDIASVAETLSIVYAWPLKLPLPRPVPPSLFVARSWIVSLSATFSCSGPEPVPVPTVTV